MPTPRPTKFIQTLKIGELYNAIRHENIDGVQRLQRFVNVNQHGNTTLRMAVASGNSAVIEMLLHSAQWLPDGELLILAAQKGDQDLYNSVHLYGDYPDALQMLQSPPYGATWGRAAKTLQPVVEEMETVFQKTVLTQHVTPQSLPSRRKSKM